LCDDQRCIDLRSGIMKTRNEIAWKEWAVAGRARSNRLSAAGID